MKRRLFVQLGRAGDVLNVLPLCLWEFKRSGLRPILMVAKHFAPLLDGTTYVERMIFDGDFEDIVGAMRQADARAAVEDLSVVCTQIYGTNLYGIETCSSFMRESWTRVPGAPAWGTLPLIFDRRDLTREAGVSANLMQRSTGKPYIVLAMSGTSSPFPHGPDFVRYIRTKLSKVFDFVDVSGFIAPRFYDLLSLLEGAHALVTVDSGLLHLAAAVPDLRVIPFITREPSRWHGSPWRAQHLRRFFYDEAPDCFREVVETLLPSYERPRLFHVWTHYDVKGIDPETTRRINFAKRTWDREYRLSGNRWLPVEFRSEHSQRDSSAEGIEDPRPVPFMKDVINHALTGPGPLPDDVIAWTNADVSFVPGITGWILDAVARQGCAFTHRWDFYKPFEAPLNSEAEAKRGEWYMGSDAFFFTVAWWRRHAAEYPDMILGREQNDEIFRQLIKRHGGLEIPGAIYHEKHASYWEHFGNRGTNPGNLYNRRLARKWFLKMGFGPNDPQWWRIPTS